MPGVPGAVVKWNVDLSGMLYILPPINSTNRLLMADEASATEASKGRRTFS